MLQSMFLMRITAAPLQKQAVVPQWLTLLNTAHDNLYQDHSILQFCNSFLQQVLPSSHTTGHCIFFYAPDTPLLKTPFNINQ